MEDKISILDKLASGPVIGDGGMCYGLEKRGYVRAGPFTPECVLENPEAGNLVGSYWLKSVLITTISSCKQIYYVLKLWTFLDQLECSIIVLKFGTISTLLIGALYYE